MLGSVGDFGLGFRAGVRLFVKTGLGARVGVRLLVKKGF